MISPGTRSMPLDAAPQPPTKRQLGRATRPGAPCSDSRRSIYRKKEGHRLGVRQHPGMVEKPLDWSIATTPIGRGKPPSATSVTSWRDRRTCSRICTIGEPEVDSYNHAVGAAVHTRAVTTYTESAWRHAALSGLLALFGTKCRKVPKSADECRDGATRLYNEYDSYTSQQNGTNDGYDYGTVCYDMMVQVTCARPRTTHGHLS